MYKRALQLSISITQLWSFKCYASPGHQLPGGTGTVFSCLCRVARVCVYFFAVAVAHLKPSSRKRTSQRAPTSMSCWSMLRQHWAAGTWDRLSCCQRERISMNGLLSTVSEQIQKTHTLTSKIAFLHLLTMLRWNIDDPCKNKKLSTWNTFLCQNCYGKQFTK